MRGGLQNAKSFHVEGDGIAIIEEEKEEEDDFDLDDFATHLANKSPEELQQYLDLSKHIG